MAPMERRFAATPWACRKMKEKSRDSGMVSATMTAARRLTRKNMSNNEDENHPHDHVVLDGVDGELYEIAAIVDRDGCGYPCGRI